LDDLRLFPFLLGHAVPLYCEEKVEKRIRKVFDYAFADREHTHAGAVPQLDFVRIGHETFEVLGSTVQPIPLSHGPYCDVLGFRFGNVAYCTDTNAISDSSMALLENLDILVLDALRYTPHATHLSVDEALAIVDRLNPKTTYLTHLSHDLEYELGNAKLPDRVRLGYDGLRFPLT
jgi:phosphoribosyl 1,2-cyclic phosphate phosphodiesterase